MDDNVYRALADVQRRRKLLALLREEPQDDSPIYLDNPPDSTIEQHITNHQMTNNHLPLLEALRFINWDIGRYEVTRGPQFRELKPLLERINEQERGFIEKE